MHEIRHRSERSEEQRRDDVRPRPDATRTCVRDEPLAKENVENAEIEQHLHPPLLVPGHAEESGETLGDDDMRREERERDIEQEEERELPIHAETMGPTA